MFKVILIYVALRLICVYLDRKADKEIYDYNHSDEDSFNEMRKVKGKVKNLDSLRRIIGFGSNAFLVMSIILVIATNLWIIIDKSEKIAYNINDENRCCQ